MVSDVTSLEKLKDKMDLLMSRYSDNPAYRALIEQKYVKKYCEFPIKHVPEVEHMVSKSKGGEMQEWDTFLLSCKYCNTRKSAEITPEKRNDYLWPDKYNTFMAFTYENGIPKVSDAFRQDVGEKLYLKAANLYKLISLNNIPKPEQADKRFS